MSSLFLLIPLSMLLVTGAATLLFWAIRSGQFDDLRNRLPDEEP